MWSGWFRCCVNGCFSEVCLLFEENEKDWKNVESGKTERGRGRRREDVPQSDSRPWRSWPAVTWRPARWSGCTARPTWGRPGSRSRRRSGGSVCSSELKHTQCVRGTSATQLLHNSLTLVSDNSDFQRKQQSCFISCFSYRVLFPSYSIDNKISLLYNIVYILSTTELQFNQTTCSS